MVFDLAKLEHYMTQLRNRNIKVTSDIPIAMDDEDDEDHKNAA